MKRVFTILLGFSLGPLALAQDGGEEAEKSKGEAQPGDRQLDAIDIVKMADAATKAVKSVKYHGKVEPSQAATDQIPVIEGTGIMAGEGQDGLDKFRFEVQIRWPGSSEMAKYVTGSDRDIHYLADVEAKTVHADIDPAVVGRLGNTINQLFAMREFSHPTPFADEMNGDLLKLVGTEKIGDEECHRVRVVYSSGRGEVFWCFSKRDRLPRRVERILRRESAAAAAYTLTVTELVVDPQLPGDPFGLVVAEGFTRTDAYAPDHPRQE